MTTNRLTRTVRIHAGTRFLISLVIALTIGSVAIAQGQTTGSGTDSGLSGLSSQSAFTSPYAVTPPFVTPLAPPVRIGATRIAFSEFARDHFNSSDHAFATAVHTVADCAFRQPIRN